MQSASAALIAAITARERQPVHEVSIDWAANGHGAAGTIDDQTPRVESVEVVRELSTNLPAQAKVVAGRSAASATMVFGAGQVDALGRPDDERRKAAWYYSDDNAGSPLTGLLREHRPTRIKAGMRGDNGPETLTQFTGWTRDSEVDGRASTATFTADDAEDARGFHDLPAILADDQVEAGGVKVGLDNSFLVDWIFRRMGYYVSPPARAGAKVLATMHGSAFAELGVSDTCYSVNFDPPAFRAAGWLEQITFGGNTTSRCRYAPEAGYIFRMTNTRTVAMECWAELTSTSASHRGLLNISNGTNGVGLFVNSSGNLALYIKTADFGTPIIHNSTLAVGTGTRRYLGVHIAFGSNTYTGSLRMDGTSQGFSTGGGFVNTTSTAMSSFYVGRALVDTAQNFQPWHGYIEDVQLSEEDITVDWNNDWASANATIMPSENKLLAVPPAQGRDAWAILEELAEAEYATISKDETGTPSYLTRSAWSAAPYTVVQRTLDTTTSIKGMVTARSVDSIRNRIIAQVQVPQVSAPAWVWESKAYINIPSSGVDIGWGAGDRVFSCGFEAPVYNLDTSFIYFGAALSPTESGYRAAKFRDGTGGAISNLTITCGPVHGDYVNVTVSNPNAFEVWLVNATGIAGIISGYPCLILYGQKVQFDLGDATSGSNLRQDVSDATSITSFGEQKLELEVNPFRQDLSSIDTLVFDLLANLKDPTRIVRSIPIVGDPRLQLGDRVNLEDPDGLVIDRDFWITRIVSTFSRTEGFGQTIDVVEAV